MISFASASMWSEASNPNNPNDSVGLIHNLALSNLYDNIEYRDLNNNTVYDNILGYANERFTVERVSQPRSMFTSNDLDALVSSYDSSNFNTTFLVNNTSLNSVVKIEMNNLITSVLDYAQGDSLVEYSDLKSIIVNWEDSIASSIAITDNDKLTLLNGSSIFRYSLNAWENVTFPKNGGYVTLGFFKNLVGSILTAAVDGVAGSVGCSMGGPVGAVLVGGSASGLAVVVLREKGYFK